MRRFKVKENGVIATMDMKIFITLHKNQVWYGKPTKDGEWELERDNVTILMQEDMLRQNFKEEI